MNRSDRNARRPDVEVIEDRTLLSAILNILSHPLHSGHGHAAGALGPPGAGQGAPPLNLLLDPMGQPTAHQLARERFVAKFQGTYQIGPPRYSSEAHQVYIRGAGGSNQFLHGDTQMRIITPSDPSLPLGGEITMFDRNINNNSALGLDLTGNQVTDVDQAGRPTRMVITRIDANISGGQYADAQASGTVDIRYTPSGSRRGRVPRQGTAIVTVHARIYTIGTNFILKNSDIDPGGPSQGG
jgi:hypothetical protein